MDDVSDMVSGPTGTGHGGGRAVSARPGAQLLIGAIDGHVHACPHLNGRSVDVFDAVEQAAAAGMRAIGLMDNFCWANDYPHHEGTYPHSAEAIERTMPMLNDLQRAKVLGLNAARLFKLDVPKHQQVGVS